MAGSLTTPSLRGKNIILTARASDPKQDANSADPLMAITGRANLGSGRIIQCNVVYLILPTASHSGSVHRYAFLLKY